MRFSLDRAANAAAWGVVFLLAAAAIVIVAILGFAGLLVLGLATWLVCTMAALDQEAPTWGVEVFKARMNRPANPEQRAAEAADRAAITSPLSFYRWCGVALTAIGTAGFAWHAWS